MPNFDKPSADLGIDAATFFDAIDHDDDLVAVVRGHIYVERRLNGLLLSETPRAESLLAKLTFSGKVDAARNMGLISSELKRALLWLGELRNRFAHQATVVSVEDSALAKARASSHGLQYINDMVEYYKRDPADVRSIVRFAIVSLYTELGYAVEERASE